MAAYFRIWNVEQLVQQMDYNQFHMWMEFNRLTQFTHRVELDNAKLLSMIHNVNTTKESHLRQPKDFMPPSIDEVIEEELEQKELDDNPQDAREAQIHNFNQHVAHLKSIGKPQNQQTIKVS